jgi:tetratricopeptide (TPR) repeat protein
MLPLLLVVLTLPLSSDLDAGKQAYAKRDYTEAAARLKAAAESSEPDTAIEALRLLAAIHRDSGQHAEAEKALAATAHRCPAGSLTLAAVQAELGAVQRAQNRTPEAMASLESAIAIRQAHPESPRADLARDLTTLAILKQRTAPTEEAIAAFQKAIAEWDQAAPADPQALPALESLATLYRDSAQYAEAEPLLFRALRLREAVNGPDGAELISTVDSLAYVEFGLRKFAEAEPIYRRLLLLWESNAGPDHPMVALTHDKMAEFYAFQQRYAEAEASALAALTARTKLHIGSLNQTGRVLLMQAKLDEAEDLYARTVQIGDLAKTPDDVMDPVLRIHAKILQTLKRPSEAAATEKRVKEALLRKADREGRRPAP